MSPTAHETTSPVTAQELPALPDNLKGKKVVLVNHSDTLGGAAVVTFRLLQALIQAGVDARMVVYAKTSREDQVDDVGTRFLRGVSFIAERLMILPAVGFNYSKVFKVSTGSFALNIHHHPWVKEADIVCLNWINQGLLGMRGIRKLHKLGKKIVWTQHDMWAMTGICHHAYECENYLKECGNCPFLSNGYSNDLSHRIWKKKRKLYTEVPIKFVTVSSWLEKLARKSSLLHDQDVRTIYNAFPVDQFYVTPPHTLPKYETPGKKNLILFGAARLDDPIKGLDYTIDALNYIFDNNPEVALNTCVFFFGSIKNPKALDRLRFSHRNLGLITDFKTLRYLYSISKVVISTSLYEILQGTLIEGQAGGALPVTFGIDGRADVVEHLKTGYIARYKDPKDIAAGIMWALKSDITRESLHEAVRDKFASAAIAEQYIELFSEMMDGDDKNKTNEK
ncbi:MAG: glycosyltransferase [Duncaniella sp.]|uniref:glycosyltransferase n=1 Tax=Duncaniella sp. TaxID=2518496 RepID=UPI0023CB4076|nr:glycosyltransferase [Duncaniella sp.]MDE6090732.1 glycosyltransferase [Duncaniella sp.]